MADRSGAQILNAVFTELADLFRSTGRVDICKTAQAIAFRTNWVDCSGDQIDCDDDLIALGLARRGADRVWYWYEQKFTCNP